MRSRFAWMLTAAWTMGCLLLYANVQHSRQFRQLERSVEDAVLRQAPPPSVNPRIVIVSIDAASLRDERIGKPPWRPHIYADILRRLQAFGAKCVAFDLVLEHVYEPRDLEFARQIEQSDIPVVLASQWSTDRVEGSIQERWTWPAREFRHADKSIAGPGRSHIGFINLPLDGELVRETCLFRPDPIFEDQLLPSFAVSIAEATRDIPSLQFDSSGTRLSFGTGEIRFRSGADGAGLCRIRYAGPTGTFRTVSVQELLGLIPHSDLNDWIDGATVLVGATAPEFHDLHDTPMNVLATNRNTRMPGVEVHANILNMLQLGHAPQLCPALIAIMWTILSSLSLFVLVLWSRPFASLGLLLLWWVLDWHVAVAAFHFFEVLLPVAAPVCLGTAFWTGGIIILWLGVHRERLRMRDVFSRCLHESVMDDLLNNGNVCPTAQNREATIFFCDIREFTRLSERLGPTQVSSLLGRYFEAMCELIYAHQGAVDKFIGDAIMAFFGTPLNDPDHARHAVECAVAMQRRLIKLNEELALEGLPQLSIGFGISTGTVVAGMFGSSRKMEYTVVGDTGNVASRMEGMNKRLGTTMLITDSTRRRLPDELADGLEIDDLGEMRIRGKVEPVHIHSVHGESSQQSSLSDGNQNQQDQEISKESSCNEIPVLQEA